MSISRYKTSNILQNTGNTQQILLYMCCIYSTSVTVSMYSTLCYIVSIYYDAWLHCLSAWVENTLQWRHNERDGVANHRLLDCLPNRLLKRRSMKTSKLRVTGLREGNPPVSGGFPSLSKKRFQLMTSFSKAEIWHRLSWCCLTRPAASRYHDHYIRDAISILVTKRNNGIQLRMLHLKILTNH